MSVTYLTGYSGTRRSLPELMAWSKFAPVHPEIQRRVIRLMDRARAAGVDLGVGGAFRSTTEQLNLFLSRHDVVASGGCCGYNGKRYALKSGAAHAAPPGRSYHEETLNGKCFALDMVNYAAGNNWMEQNLAAHGMRSFATLSSNREPWHIQPVEIPTSRSSYNPTVHVITTWALPPAPTAPVPSVPQPTIRLGSSGPEVVKLQNQMKFWGWYPYTVDGAAGPKTVEGIKKLQTACKVGADGVYGPVTSQAFARFLVSMASLG